MASSTIATALVLGVLCVACAGTPAPDLQKSAVSVPARIASLEELLAVSTEAVRAAYARYARAEPSAAPDSAEAEFRSDGVSDLLRHAQAEPDAWKRDLFLRTAKDQFWRGGFDPVVGDALGLSAQGDADAFRRLVALRTQETDLSNTAFLKAEIDRRGAWPGKSAIGDGASHFAWLLVQHADRDPEFQQRALKLMEPLVSTGEIDASDFAYLFDRVAVAAGRPQRYGSQGWCAPGEGRWEPRPVEDPDSLDTRRASVGLGPMADYIAIFQQPGLCGRQ